MAIAIRGGIRYRFKFVFSGPTIDIDRYEREHLPSDWMFVIRDYENDLEMEWDAEDAIALDEALRQFNDGLMSGDAVEAILRGLFGTMT